MRELVAAVAGPRLVNDSRESWLRRAARRAGCSHRQAKALFYGENKNPNSRTARKFRVAAGRQDASDLAQRFEAAAESLALRDQTRHRADVAALLAAARKLRDLAKSDPQ